VINKEFAQKWVDALRSDEYKQNSGTLVDDATNPQAFCCIGVAGCLLGLLKKGQATNWSYCVDVYAYVQLAVGYDELAEGRFINMNDQEKKVIRSDR
jgi:hypothetical protein